jgi:hypothetical protein
LTPEVHLATATGRTERQLRDAMKLIETHLKEVQDAWYQHFGS